MANPRPDYMHLVLRRLDWARAGIDRFEELANAFLATKPYEVLPHMKHKGKFAQISYVIKLHRQLVPELRFAAGDVIHNLRSVVDNLVWGLGQRFKASNLLGLEFLDPTSDQLPLYLVEIHKLPKPIYDWILSVQPGDRADDHHILHRLHNLWNRDKHRTPVLVAGASHTAGLRGSELPYLGRFQTFQIKGAKDNEKIAEALVVWEQRRNFNPVFSPKVAFDRNGPAHGAFVSEFLRQIDEHIVNEVVPKFKPYF